MQRYHSLICVINLTLNWNLGYHYYEATMLLCTPAASLRTSSRAAAVWYVQKVCALLREISSVCTTITRFAKLAYCQTKTSIICFPDCRRQPHLLHVCTVDRRQTWSMDKSWRCVTLSGFLHSHIVRCWWNPISCGTHYSGPGLSENDSAVTTDVCEDQNREVRLWGLPLKWNWPP